MIHFPEIILELHDKLEDETNLTSFTCRATGKPVPNITWYFNGVVIEESDANKYKITRSIMTTLIESTLRVFNVTLSDIGTYVCNATNELGSDISIGVLTMNSKIFFCKCAVYYSTYVQSV